MKPELVDHYMKLVGAEGRDEPLVNRMRLAFETCPDDMVDAARAWPPQMWGALSAFLLEHNNVMAKLLAVGAACMVAPPAAVSWFDDMLDALILAFNNRCQRERDRAPGPRPNANGKYVMWMSFASPRGNLGACVVEVEDPHDAYRAALAAGCTPGDDQPFHVAAVALHDTEENAKLPRNKLLTRADVEALGIPMTAMSNAAGNFDLPGTIPQDELDDMATDAAAAMAGVLAGKDGGGHWAFKPPRRDPDEVGH